MPGLPLLPTEPSFQGAPGQNMPSAGSAVAARAGVGWSFWLWLIVIGVVIPGIILGSLRAGGYQFVFRRR